MARQKISSLEVHIGYWMRAVSNSVSQAFAQKLGSLDVTVAEWVILREMYEREEAMNPSEIAASIGLTRGAVSKLVDRLIQKKLIDRKFSAEDGRFQEIQLSRSAVKLVPDLATLADQNDEEFFGELSREEKKTLMTLLQKVVSSRKIKEVPIE